MPPSPFCTPSDDLTPLLGPLLGRPEIAVDMAAIRPWLSRARILITGAGGTLGSALAQQLLPLAPAKLILLDHAEHGLWRLTQSLSRAAPQLPLHPVLADIRDSRRLHAICAATRPDFVLHAAALKHLPMVESDPLEGLLTNTIGTRIVAQAARESGARALLLLSTDKAVDPSSVMGASKRLAELHCLAEDHAANPGMRHFVIRFGNVLASSGSVLEHWRAECAAGIPLSLTHPAMARYFLTKREAARLILQLLANGLAGAVPPGGLCVPDMGPPILLRDLAHRLLHAIGPNPNQNPNQNPLWHITGIRPGEKLTESLLHENEPAHPLPNTALRLAIPRAPEAPLLARALDELESLCRAGDERLALQLVSRLIPGFRNRTACREGRLRA